MNDDSTPPRLPNRPALYGNLPPSPFAPLFIQKLMLAIIEANPCAPDEFGAKDPTHIPSLRLGRAIHALFGVKPEKTSAKDLLALIKFTQTNLAVASERQFEIKMEGKEPREATTSFSAIVDAQGNTATQSAGRNDYVRLMRKSESDAFSDYLYVVTQETEHAEEKAMQADLLQIAAVLARWGVELTLDPDKLGMHSLSPFWPAP